MSLASPITIPSKRRPWVAMDRTSISKLLSSCSSYVRSCVGHCKPGNSLSCRGISQNVGVASKLHLKVWKRSESKKKGKKRHLAAVTTVTFGELLDKASSSPRACEVLFCLVMFYADGNSRCGAETWLPRRNRQTNTKRSRAKIRNHRSTPPCSSFTTICFHFNGLGCNH